MSKRSRFANGFQPLGSSPFARLGNPGQGKHTVGNWESDNAWDFGAKPGTPVYAVGSGTIDPSLYGALSSSGRFGGNRLHLRTSGNEFFYQHLGKLVAKPGQRVKRGDLLGYVGNIPGIGPHLHFAEKNLGVPDAPDAPAASLPGSSPVLDLIRQGSAKYGLDPNAVASVASVEGGLNWGAVGDNGSSFGPFQLHEGGALPKGRDAAWANSPEGIDYALRVMAQAGARGLKGPEAVDAIVRKFEIPTDPAGEVQRALVRLGQGFPQGTPSAPENTVQPPPPPVVAPEQQTPSIPWGQQEQVTPAVQGGDPMQAIGLALLQQLRDQPRRRTLLSRFA